MMFNSELENLSFPHLEAVGDLSLSTFSFKEFWDGVIWRGFMGVSRGF